MPTVASTLPDDQVRNWLDLQALAEQVGEQTARRIMATTYHAALDGRPVIEAGAVQDMLAMAEGGDR